MAKVVAWLLVVFDLVLIALGAAELALLAQSVSVWNILQVILAFLSVLAGALGIGIMLVLMKIGKILSGK